ncbi:MAG: M1 family aminopeptidase [Candidatus Obscuribacterales bacterium]
MEIIKSGFPSRLIVGGLLAAVLASTLSLRACAYPASPKYAPDRKIEIDHLALDLTPDFKKRSIAGTMTMTFKALGKPLEELVLDASYLDIGTVTCDRALAGYQADDEKLTVTLAEPLPPGEPANLTVVYSGHPRRGIYFRSPSNGYPEAETHLYTQGEMIEARHWFPCYDYPNAKFTSEITCHVPSGMSVFSNGKKIASKTDSRGLTSVTYKQDSPHVSYLISLVAGKFHSIESKSGDIPLAFHTLAGDDPEAPAAFAPTADAMDYLQKEIGIPYPWGSYGQAVVKDYYYTGMENTSLTTLSDSVLYSPDCENLFAWGGLYCPDGSYRSEPVLVHELAHQWFGDLVTCKDWSHAWLNEGFATYYSLLYAGHAHGRDDMTYGLYQNLKHVLEHDDGRRPVVDRHYDHPYEQFDHRAYAKAALILHMIRSQLGEDLFRRCVKTYLERHRYRSVVSEDFNRILEELSGRSFDRFFDQWLYKPGQPELDVQYSWDEKSGLARVSINQKPSRPVSDDSKPYWLQTGHHRRAGEGPQTQTQIHTPPTVYHFPLLLRFKAGDTVIDHPVEIKEGEEDFYVKLEKAPDIVRIDPDLTLLARINFNPPAEMLLKQLQDRNDTAGRILAAEKLDRFDNEKTLDALKTCLQSDEFYGVRVVAARTLRRIHTPEALTVLCQSLAQKDARVRNAVVDAIGYFFSPRAESTLVAHIAKEKNPAITATTLKALGPFHSRCVRDLLTSSLSRQSYRNMIAVAALKAIRAQDDPSYKDAIVREIDKRSPDFEAHGIGTALSTLAFIARNEKDKSDIRNLLAGFLDSPRQSLRLSAINALGELEEHSAIAMLDTFASAARETPERDSAKRAIARLRSAGKPADNLKDLRDEVIELQKSQRDLKKDLDALKKQLDKRNERKPQSGGK